MNELLSSTEAGVVYSSLEIAWRGAPAKKHLRRSLAYRARTVSIARSEGCVIRILRDHRVAQQRSDVRR